MSLVSRDQQEKYLMALAMHSAQLNPRVPNRLFQRLALRQCYRMVSERGKEERRPLVSTIFGPGMDDGWVDAEREGSTDPRGQNHRLERRLGEKACKFASVFFPRCADHAVLAAGY